jgi:ABC-type multidrug transport system permease subunit
VEIPYQVVQTLVFGVMTYFMMGFERNFGKISIFPVEMLHALWILDPPKIYILKMITFLLY